MNEKQNLDDLINDLINKQHLMDGAILRLLQVQNHKISELELKMAQLQLDILEKRN